MQILSQLTTTGEELAFLDHDLSDLSDFSEVDHDLSDLYDLSEVCNGFDSRRVRSYQAFANTSGTCSVGAESTRSKMRYAACVSYIYIRYTY